MKFLIFALMIFLSYSCFSKYSSPSILDIPIDRLIANIEEAVKKDPLNKDLNYELARAYSLAFVTKNSRVLAGNQSQLYIEPKRNKKIIFWRENDVAFEKNSKSSEYLKKSIEIYSTAIKFNLGDMKLYLGRGWAHLQFKNNILAKKDFIYIIDQVKTITNKPTNESKWDLENTKIDKQVLAEAIDYLLPLIDSKKDSELFNKINEIKKNGALRPNSMSRSPIIIPLYGDNHLDPLTNKANFVHFDLDGEGPKEWEWINPNAGFLVFLGKNKNSVVTSGLQLFGNVTFWIFWNNGYEVLSALDDDHNEYLSEHELDGLYIWQDKNSDGICTRDEILTLENFKIKKIFTQHQAHETGIEFNSKGIELHNGRFIPTYDWVSRSKDLL